MAQKLVLDTPNLGLAHERSKTHVLSLLNV